MNPDRSVQTTLAFHASRIVIDIGVLLAMASMSMTFVSSPTGNRSALAADAFPAVLLLLPIFAMTLIPNHTRPLPPVVGWISMVLGLAALPYAFVKMLDAGVLAETLGGSVGFGPKLLLFGCVITLLGIGVGLVRDLMGWPSAGTATRQAAVRPTTATTKRPDPAPTRVTAATGTVSALPTRDAEPAEAQTKVLSVSEPVVESPTIRPASPATPAAPRERPVATPATPAAPHERPVTPPVQPPTRPAIAPAQATAPTLGAPRRDAASPEQAPTPPQTPPSDETAPTAPVQAVAPRPQPEPVVDTGALFPGFDPIDDVSDYDPEPEPDDPTMTTAERADAAMTDHLLSMFDDTDDEDISDEER